MLEIRIFVSILNSFIAFRLQVVVQVPCRKHQCRGPATLTVKVTDHFCFFPAGEGTLSVEVLWDSIGFESLRAVIGSEHTPHSRPIKCSLKQLISLMFPRVRALYRSLL